MAAPMAGPAAARKPWIAVGPRRRPGDRVRPRDPADARTTGGRSCARLSDRYRCIAIDLPGHGERAGEPFSMAAASDAVVAAIEAEVPSGRAVVVGLSLGGYVAIEAAERCPERIAGLVLAGCSAEPVGPVGGPVPRARLGPRPRPAGPFGVANRGYFRLRYGRAIADPIIAGGFWSAGGAEALRVLARTRFVERLGRLWTPVLVVNGALDPVFGPGGDPWAAACRRGRHVVLSRAMHLANLDRPARSRTLVAAFAADPAGTA